MLELVPEPDNPRGPHAISVWATTCTLKHTSAAMTLDVYGRLWDDHLDTLPGAITQHMEAERARAKVRKTRREDRAQRRKLQAVDEKDVG